MHGNARKYKIPEKGSNSRQAEYAVKLEGPKYPTANLVPES